MLAIALTPVTLLAQYLDAGDCMRSRLRPIFFLLKLGQQLDAILEKGSAQDVMIEK
ncbi:MAG: hypothetical protein AB1861_13395 [Cyanobacteriota bacterium]